jgi:alpha-L-rhamnosidase
MLLRSKIFIVLMLAFGVCSAQQPVPDSNFLHPPAVSSPWIFWYWMQAAVSKAGIHADLLAMKEAGIGGAYLMPIQGAAHPPVYTPVVEQLSPLWWEMVGYAMQQADSLGLQLAMHDCDGFAVAGGPWITPELSMQKVVWTRTGVVGGKAVDMVLQKPVFEEGYYRDIEVLAFPTPADWDVSTQTVLPVVTTSTGADASFLVKAGNHSSFASADSCWIQYAFDRSFTCRSIVINGVNNYQAQRLLVSVSDDGVHFRSVGRLVPPRVGWQDGDAPVTHSIPTVTAKYFRFVYDKTGAEPGAEDLDDAKWKPSLKLSGILLSGAPAVDQYEGKSGEVWRVSAAMTAAQVPRSLCVDPRTIIDLTDRVDTQGRLVWKAPAGHWTVLRIGHTSTGHTNATGGAAQGLECDKFNPQAITLQFNSWFGEVFRHVGPALAAKVLKIFHVDSWECGSQNWSPVFREEFRRRRGYDCLPWLPVMAGIPMGSADSSERFLHDMRQTIAELLHDEFYETMARLAHEKGCLFSAESVAPTMTSDGMLHYSVADLPMGEFWLRSPTHDKPNDMLDAISGAHIYGKPIVQAEAFTELREAWDEYPGMLKSLQDRNYALGINRMVFHVFVHNPWIDRKPGMTLGGVGTFLQRDQIWWPVASAWVDYTRRCQWLLQQGAPVADIGVFTGEELPRRAVLPERLVGTLPGLMGWRRVHSEALRLANTGEPTTKVPNGVVRSANMTDVSEWIDPLQGYAYDSYNSDALLRLASVRDGRVVFPGGTSYALLVLPGAYPLSPDPGMISAAVARRLLELVRDGATLLVGDPGAVVHSTGLVHAVADDSVVRKVFSEFLGGGGRIVSVGKGRVIKGPYTDSTLDMIGVARDFIAMEDTAHSRGAHTGDGPMAEGVAYTHRVLAGAERASDASGASGVSGASSGDIYFVSNQTDRPRRLVLSLRDSGRIAEKWDAVTGKIDWVYGGASREGRTILPLYLPPNGSIFIVFRKVVPPIQTNVLLPGVIHTDIDTDPHVAMTLTGPWMVQFDSASRGPVGPVRFDSLIDWSRHSDSAIRYYSGRAEYRLSFSWTGLVGAGVLDLGRVADVARVTLNGVDCGIVWTAPYRVDVSHALRQGGNELRVEVFNTWANRLAGDERLVERATWTPVVYKGEGGLPGGLLGPVRVVR